MTIRFHSRFSKEQLGYTASSKGYKLIADDKSSDKDITTLRSNKLSPVMRTKDSRFENTSFILTLGSVTVPTRNIARTIEFGGKLMSPTIERSIQTGAILSQDQLRIIANKKGSGEESIYSSFDDDSVERDRFDDIVSIATLDKSVQEIKKQTKADDNFLKLSTKRPQIVEKVSLTTSGVPKQLRRPTSALQSRFATRFVQRSPLKVELRQRQERKINRKLACPIDRQKLAKAFQQIRFERMQVRNTSSPEDPLLCSIIPKNQDTQFDLFRVKYLQKFSAEMKKLNHEEKSTIFKQRHLALQLNTERSHFTAERPSNQLMDMEQLTQLHIQGLNPDHLHHSIQVHKPEQEVETRVDTRNKSSAIPSTSGQGASTKLRPRNLGEYSIKTSQYDRRNTSTLLGPPQNNATVIQFAQRTAERFLGNRNHGSVSIPASSQSNFMIGTKSSQFQKSRPSEVPLKVQLLDAPIMHLIQEAEDTFKNKQIFKNGSKKLFSPLKQSQFNFVNPPVMQSPSVQLPLIRIQHSEQNDQSPNPSSLQPSALMRNTVLRQKKANPDGRKSNNATELNDSLHVEGTGQQSHLNAHVAFVQEEPVITRRKKGYFGTITSDNVKVPKKKRMLGQNSVATLSLTSNLIASNQTAQLGQPH